MYKSNLDVATADNTEVRAVMNLLYGTGDTPCEALDRKLLTIETAVRTSVNANSGIVQIGINYLDKPDNYRGDKDQVPSGLDLFMCDSGKGREAVNPNMNDLGPAANWTDPFSRSIVYNGASTFPPQDVPLCINDEVWTLFINPGIFQDVRLIITSDRSCILTFVINYKGIRHLYGTHIDQRYKARPLSAYSTAHPLARIANPRAGRDRSESSSPIARRDRGES